MGGTPSIPFRLLFAALGVVWLALLVRNPASLVWFLLLAVAYSFIQRYRFLAVVHIQVEFSDILPLIQLGAHNFLTGTSPYVIYDLPPVLPLVYLPVTWLSYVPTIAAGLDMRYTNLIAELGIVLVFLSLVFPKRHLPEVNFAVGYAAFLFVLPTAMFWDSFTAHPIWWFWLLLSMRFLIAQKFFLAALALGVTLATAQLAIVILPVIALYLLRKAGVVRALLYFVVMAAVALLIIAPFAYRDPFKFINDTFLYYGDLKNYGRVLWKDDQRWQYILGFGGEAWRRGFPDALRYVQGALTVILAGVYAFLIPNTAANVLRAAAVNLGFFLLFSAVVWHYYYQAVFFLVLYYVAALSMQARAADQGVVTS
jgi:hypothetical protein